LDSDSFQLLTGCALHYGHTKSAFASAAIRYFAERGLDPTVSQTASLEHKLDALGHKIDGETLRIRQQNVDIANRLIGLLRGWQKDSYEFHHNVQKELINYLQSIESSILRHQLEQEKNIFWPIIENLFRINFEASTSRGFGQLLYLISISKQDDLKAHRDRTAKDLEEEVLEMQQAYTQKYPMPTTYLSAKPAPTPIPERKPIVPAGSVPSAPASAPPEASKP
jgi:hypothetical protein